MRTITIAVPDDQDAHEMLELLKVLVRAQAEKRQALQREIKQLWALVESATLSAGNRRDG